MYYVYVPLPLSGSTCYLEPTSSSSTCDNPTFDAAAGLLAAMPQALSSAASVLMARDSPAPTDFTITQYMSLLLEFWSTLFRRTPTECLRLKDDDPLAPLLLPGATLAAAALRAYAGPDGASIRAANHCTSGHDGTVVLSLPVPDARKLTPAAIRQLQQQMLQQLGSTACASIIASALRVADTMSILTYNAVRLYIGPEAGSQPGGETDADLGRQNPRLVQHWAGCGAMSVW